MKKNTVISLYYITSVLYYIIAVIRFFNSGFASGVIWFGLGSVFLCIGAGYPNKKSDDEDNQ